MRRGPYRWSKSKALRRNRDELVNYRPSPRGSEDYATRHQETVIDLGGGMTRVDVGAPAHAPGRTFVPMPEEAPAVPESEPVEEAQPLPASEPVGPERDWRGDYGLSKNG